MTTSSVLALIALLLAKDPGPPPAPSYAQQVRPFFAKYCLECHNHVEVKGGLNLENYLTLLQGGAKGQVVVAGNPDSSRLVLLVEGKSKPAMPPKKAKQPRREEVAVLRAWVAAGARNDMTAISANLPAITPRRPVHPPISALTYHPSGKWLAAGGYQHVYFLDAATGGLAGQLTDLSGSATALAFSRDGRSLAVAISRPGMAGEVRIYPVPAQGVPADRPRLTLAAHRDVIHDIAWSPDGRLLATCGYDRLIKLWDAATGKELHTLKDHSDAVYSLAFSPDGRQLASGAADRAVKVWDTATGQRRYTLSESTDWVYAVAWSPDGRHLAAAGVDKSIRLWEVSGAGAKLVRSVFGHEKPVVRLVYAADGQTLYSFGEDRTVKAWDARRLTERHVYPSQPEAILALAVRPDRGQLALGRYDGVAVLLDEASGRVQAEPLPLKPVDLYPALTEHEPNDSPATGTMVKLPVTLVGALGKPGDVDYVRFAARSGQEIGVQAQTAALGARFEPVLMLCDADGRVIAEGTRRLLGYTCPKAGAYALGIRDQEYRGGPEYTYRLHVGDIPIITGVFPLGIQRGTEAEVQLDGVNLKPPTAIRVMIPAAAAVGSRVPVPLPASAGTPLGDHSVVVGEFPEVRACGELVPVPGTANGRIDRPGATDTWKFTARKGQRLIVETHARRLGSPLDSYVEILDAQSRPVPRATLRALARTYTTFRDHDSSGAGIRIESWNELTVNDYLWAGGELLRIRALPKTPDDDCQFFSVGGQRVGYLDTTPAHHSLGSPMYKVEIHPPGATFPPNGMPAIQLFYRNDDGGPGYGKDSRLFFDPPADGIYQVRIGDARGQGDRNYAYRLTIRPPRPSFNIRFDPPNPAVWRGGAVPVAVTAERIDGYTGPIAVQLENVPDGFHAPATNLPAEEMTTAFALQADASAKEPSAAMPPLKLVARARIDGQEVTREFTGQRLRLRDAGDIVTTTEQSEVVVTPGSQVLLTARIERRNGFAGRVPVEVQGLPHGVRVLDIGLNGILITEKDDRRTFAIYCEPWVKPITHPFVVLARQEGKGTEHAAPSVLLRIIAPPK